jgi:hypothetical protein
MVFQGFRDFDASRIKKSDYKKSLSLIRREYTVLSQIRHSLILILVESFRKIQCTVFEIDFRGGRLGKQDFRRTDFGSRPLAAEGEGGGGSEGEGCV